MDDDGQVDYGDTYDTDEAAFLTSRLAIREEAEELESRAPQVSPPRYGHILGAEEDEGDFALDVLGAPAGDTPLSYGEELDSLMPSRELGLQSPRDSEADEGTAEDVAEDDYDNDEDDDVVDTFGTQEHTTTEKDGAGDGEGGDRGAFAFSRVKELLKYHSGFTIVSKDAVLIASEAVVLILQDLTRLAAAQAERHNRKTVRYADVASVVQHYDRFSFLSDVLPSANEGRQSSSGTQRKQKARAATASQLSRTSHSFRRQPTVNQQADNRKRQVKLSFGRTDVSP